MSNSNRVSIDNLSSKIMEYLQEYKEDISEEVKNTTNKLIKEAAGELKHISPKAKKRVYLRKWKIQGISDWVEPRKLCKILEYKK